MREGNLSLYRFYYVSWIGLIGLASGLSGLAEWMVPSFQLLCSLLALWALVPRWPARWRAIAPGPGKVAVAVGMLLAIGGTFAWIERDALSAVGTVLWSMLVIFFYRGQRAYGHWLALFTLAAVALIGVILREEMVPFFLFLLFLVVLVLNLNATNLFLLAGAGGARRYRLPRGYLRKLLIPMAWGAAAAALIFFFFPRTTTWENPLGLRKRDRVTGYTGTISLEGNSDIHASSAVDLLVESADPVWLSAQANGMYVRGNTVERFDGSRWTALPRRFERYRYSSDVRYTTRHEGRTHRVRMYREPHAHRAVLYPHVLVGIFAPGGVVGHIEFDGAGNLRRARPGLMRYAYDVLVAEPLPPKGMDREPLRQYLNRIREDVDSGRLARAEYEAALEIPAAVGEAAYFRNWVREVGTESRELPLGDLLSRLNEHFRNRFSVSLRHEFRDKIALKGFLSEQRVGHCEYFATAGALFLRSLGIPARLVLGYRGGTFNEISRVLEVRGENAHAWVEVYAPGGQWVRFDPTPMRITLAGNGLRDRLGLYYNAFRFWFQRYVIHYNNVSQRQLVRSLTRWSFRRNVRENSGTSGPYLWWVAGMGTVALAWLLWRRRRREAAESGEALPEYYAAFLKQARERGWRRRPGETRAAFHRRLREAGFPAPWEDRLTRVLYRDLYSSSPAPAEERHAMENLPPPPSVQ